MRSHHSTEPAGKTIVLIPGAGHGIWCWQKIIPLLEAAGHTVLSTALPGTNANPEKLENISLEDDVATAPVPVAAVFVFAAGRIPSENVSVLSIRSRFSCIKSMTVKGILIGC